VHNQWRALYMNGLSLIGINLKFACEPVVQLLQCGVRFKLYQRRGQGKGPESKLGKLIKVVAGFNQPMRGRHCMMDNATDPNGHQAPTQLLFDCGGEI
jgi:hypothetical protein